MPTRPARLTRLLAVLLVAGAAGCAAPVAVPTTASLPEPAAPTALSVERAVGRIAAHAGGNALWPEFDLLAVPLAIYDGEQTVLFRHPAPPEGFAAASGVPLAFVYEGRHAAMSANSSAEIGGVQTATVLLGDAGQSLADLAALAAHEAFHVFQRERHPAWAGNEADLFVYPADDAVLLARRRLETEALRRALSARTPDEAAGWARRALALRAERYAVLDSAAAAYERGTELNEGLATYVGVRAGGAEPELPAAEFGPSDIRRRAYATGFALAWLLDRFAPGWPRSFEADSRQTLDGALARTLGPGAAPAFDADEVAEAERRARADVEALAAMRAERVAAFEARPGWRVVVEAADGQALWPQRFDPIHVERVGPGRVLHARFLQLGNEAGQVEMLDGAAADPGPDPGQAVEALTDGAGPHPLFNGVRRVVVAGLAEPVLSEAGGTVTVTAPGFRATFRGASVGRSGAVVTIRLSA